MQAKVCGADFFSQESNVTRQVANKFSVRKEKSVSRAHVNHVAAKKSAELNGNRIQTINVGEMPLQSVAFDAAEQTITKFEAMSCANFFGNGFLLCHLSKN